MRLRDETDLHVGYAACSTADEYRKARADHDPDAVIVNYRADLAPWWRQVAHEPGGVRWAVAHNYEPGNLVQHAQTIRSHGFDRVLALDPPLYAGTAWAEHGVDIVGRPLPPTARTVPGDGPARIGTFGFAFPHKGFVEVAREVNMTLAEGTFDLHMPEAWFNGAEGRPLYGPAILDSCRDQIDHGGRITFHHTSNHLPSPDLVDRLGKNDVNILLYAPGQPDAGLSSALDYLIAARRPAIVTDCAMFRHGLPHVAVWPAVTLRDVLNHREQWERQATALWWAHTGRFSSDIETVLDRWA